MLKAVTGKPGYFNDRVLNETEKSAATSCDMRIFGLVLYRLLELDFI